MMEASPSSLVTPKVTGMVTQTRWVNVTVVAVPSALVVQVTVGDPWQEVEMVPTVAVGISTTFLLTSTHWVPLLLQPVVGGVRPVVPEWIPYRSRSRKCSFPSRQAQAHRGRG